MAASTKSEREIVIRMEGKVDHLVEQVGEIVEWINGNGKPGMKSEHALLLKDVESLKKSAEEKKTRGWQVTLLGIGQIVSLAGLVVAILLGLK